MARNGTATVTEDQTNEHGEVETGSKRERVDLNTLADDEKVVVSFHVPAGMKKALIAAGQAHSKTYTAWARDVLAERLEYEIPESFSERTRESKYASEEERKAATAARGKQQRAEVKSMLAALQENPETLELLKQRGINLEVLGIKK